MTSAKNLIVWLLATSAAGCAAEVVPREADPAAAEQALTSDECPRPKPRNIGCRIACKPCLVPVCEDGAWVYERIEWGDECDPIPSDSECCQVPLSGGCPAECACCEYN